MRHIAKLDTKILQVFVALRLIFVGIVETLLDEFDKLLGVFLRPVPEFEVINGSRINVDVARDVGKLLASFLLI